MGIDCKIMVGNEYIDLDRWYVFSPLLESGKTISKQCAIDIIEKLSSEKRLLDDTILWGDRQQEFIKKYRHWIYVARSAIESASETDIIIFYSEHDVPDEYYE